MQTPLQRDTPKTEELRGLARGTLGTGGQPGSAGQWLSWRSLESSWAMKMMPSGLCFLCFPIPQPQSKLASVSGNPAGPPAQMQVRRVWALEPVGPEFES